MIYFAYKTKPDLNGNSRVLRVAYDVSGDIVAFQTDNGPGDLMQSQPGLWCLAGEINVSPAEYRRLSKVCALSRTATLIR